MALYEFHLRRNGYAGHRVYQELADDLEAFKTAEALSSNFDVEAIKSSHLICQEVWQPQKKPVVMNAVRREVTCPHCGAVYPRELVARIFRGHEDVRCLACDGAIAIYDPRIIPSKHETEPDVE